MSSILNQIMADVFANLPKAERLEKAVQACQQDCRLTARKAGKIYNVVHSTISRRLRELHKPKKVDS
jgi:predicted HTH transcriptional regulator